MTSVPIAQVVKPCPEDISSPHSPSVTTRFDAVSRTVIEPGRISSTAGSFHRVVSSFTSLSIWYLLAKEMLENDFRGSVTAY
jgi:hypothetical protein